MYKQHEDYKDCRMQEWNKFGNSLMFEDYNFPIVALVNYTEVQFLKHDVSEILFGANIQHDIKILAVENILKY